MLPRRPPEPVPPEELVDPAGSDASSGSCLSPEQALSFVRNASGTCRRAACTPTWMAAPAAGWWWRRRRPSLTGDASGPASLRALADGETILDRYEIQRFIARGGMGEVYEAVDTVLGGKVALKTLLPTALDDQSSIERFLDEVRLARKVSHPNVCRILEFGSTAAGREEDAIPFLDHGVPGGRNGGQPAGSPRSPRSGRGPQDPGGDRRRAGGDPRGRDRAPRSEVRKRLPGSRRRGRASGRS